MLKDKMISDMIVHGYSERTIKSYTECMTKLAAFYMISPLKMKPSHIYNFFLHIRKKKLCESSITVFYSSFLLFYTLAKKKYMMKDIPVPKKPTKVATVLNKSEITSFLNHCSSIKEKAIYTLLYSSGIRIGELVKLKIEDIDFERKAIFIREGKGNKQRYAILSDHAAFLIKQYICGYRPASYLFFSTKGKNHPINMRWIQVRLKEICKTAGIIKNATVHTLRHSFASHLLDDGYSIFYIQKLLGHTAINSTLIYLHVNPQYLLQIPSPMEKIHNAKLSIFENHIEYGLDLKMAL